MALQLLPASFGDGRHICPGWWVGFAVVFRSSRATWQCLMIMRFLHAVGFGIELEVAAALLWV